MHPFEPNGILTFSSDFGTADGYVGAMKGRALALCPELRVVDIAHETPPWDIRRGAFSLWTALPFFPEGTVHVAVVDPGVGTDRRALVARTAGQVIVAPDNGLISMFLHREACTEVYGLDLSRYLLPPQTKTFHGRDLFAPVGARIAANQLSVPGSLPGLLDPVHFPCSYTKEGNSIVGTVICWDNFGNLITSIPWTEIPDPQRASINVGDCCVDQIVETYGESPPRSVVALQGSSGLLEISCVQANAQQELGVLAGCPVTIQRGD